MGSSRNRRGQANGKNRAWDEWQRYLKKETQRIKQKQRGNIVEVKFSRPPQPLPPEEPVQTSEHEVPDAYVPRQAPVPSVPREEALQVSDDQIGSTVKPFTVNDYKNIRPLNSPDLFESDSESGTEEALPVEETPELVPPPARLEPTPVENVTEAISHLDNQATIEEAEKSTGPARLKKKKKGKGQKKGKGNDGELELFDSVSGHQVIARQRLTRKSKLDREELIEKLLDPVISLEEAATLMGVCKTTVRRYTNRNELECLRTPGQQRRFKLSHVLEFVKKREQNQKNRKPRGDKRD